MHLKEIQLNNFRNYKEEIMQFHKNINWIFGENAQGKTNLLEAIYLLMKTTSFRSPRMEEWIHYDCPHAYIKGIFEENTREYEVEYIMYRDGKKNIILNEEEIKKNNDIFRLFHCVLFTPDDLRLIKDGPSLRRNYIDRLISGLCSEYAQQIHYYNKILFQRNNLLKFGKNKKYFKEQMRVLNHQFIELGSYIILKRNKYVQLLDSISRIIHGHLTYNKEILQIIYETDCLKGKNNDYDEIKKNLTQALIQQFPIDLEKMNTGIGPHRDDLMFKINHRDARSYASQGQQRTAVFSLILSEVQMIENQFQKKSILLLDDIFSELDEKRQQYFLESLKDGQVFITTAGEIKNIKNQGELFRVIDGRIIEERWMSLN